MEEERKLPKNIRQMAEKEDRVRVYMEDYVYTFIHKLDCKQGPRTGVLLGKRMIIQEKRCWFVSAAVELEGECSEEGWTLQDQIWENAQSVIHEYFQECNVCGWFICAEEEGFPDKEGLKKTHQQIFSGENCLMYWKEGEEDSFWMEEEGAVLHLKGYFIYYEKNQEMQNYMLSRKTDQSENVSDQAALNFRKIMKEKQEKQIRRTDKTQNKMWIWTGAAAVVLAVAAIFLSVKGITGKKDQVQALAVGASVEMRSEEDTDEITRKTSEAEADETTEASNEGVTIEETSEMDKIMASEKTEETENIMDEVQDEKSKAAKEVQSESMIFSEEMMFYQNGLGATVYRITSKENSASEENKADADKEDDDQEILKVEIPTLEAKEENETVSGKEEVSVNRPASYTVQPGDTLIQISNKFYGSSEMVMQIKELNELKDINKIYIGQELKLP